MVTAAGWGRRVLVGKRADTFVFSEEIALPSNVGSMEWLDNSTVVVGCDNSVVYAVDCLKQTVTELCRSRKHATSLAIGGDKIAVGGIGGNLYVYNSMSGADLFRVENVGIGWTTCAISENDLAVVGGTSAEFVVYDIASGSVVARRAVDCGPCARLSFSPDSSLLAVAGENGTIELWDTTGWERSAVLNGHRDTCSSLTFDASGSRLVSVGRDRTARIWDTTDFEELLIVPTDFPCMDVAILSDSSGFMVVGERGQYEFTTTATRRVRQAE